MVHPQRQCTESREAEEIWLVTRIPHKLLQMYNRQMHNWAASQPGAATTPPITAGLSRGWGSLHNASLGANYMPSRTSTTPMSQEGQKDHQGMPVHPATLQKARSVQVHQSWDREAAFQSLSQGHQTVKQPSLRQWGCCLHTDLKSLATLINGSLVTSHFQVEGSTWNPIGFSYGDSVTKLSARLLASWGWLRTN